MLAGRHIPDLTLHDHLCLVYRRDSEAQQALLEYVVAGLARRERVYVLTMPDTATDTLEADLRRIGVPFDDMVADHALVIGSAEQVYLTDGFFDTDRCLQAYARAARSAVDEGFTGLRAYAESQVVLDHPEALAAWPGYELRADLHATELPITVVCAYDARRWPADDLMLAEAVHAGRSRDHTAFWLRTDHDGLLRLSGEIDFAVSKELHRLLVTTASNRCGPVLDVSGVSFVDLGAARSLGAACEAVARRHGPTTIRGATSLLRKIWALTSWSDSFPNVIIED